MPRIIVGLPSLSRGPLLSRASALGAPVMISASALSRWRDEGPVTPGWEFTSLERSIRQATNDTRPPSAAQRRRRRRTWDGWNLGALDRVQNDGMEIHVDSAGFVAMALHGGFPWTPEAYVLELGPHRAIARLSCMDLCVEVEIAHGRDEVRERISKTVNLNHTCMKLAREAGIVDKMMPIIQGSTADDYVRCFNAIASIIPSGATVGIGSMCRRPTGGPDGTMAILERLDRELPKDVRLHLFGVKNSGAEAACVHGERIDSVDSQSYGVHARHLANERRREDPTFSKRNAFVADVMEKWYLDMKARLERPKPYPVQPQLPIATSTERPRTVVDAIELVVRAQFNDLIEERQLDHDQIIGGRMLEECVMEMLSDLPDDVDATQAWEGVHQLPASLTEDARLPYFLQDSGIR